MPSTNTYAIAAAAVIAAGLGVGSWIAFGGGGEYDCGGTTVGGGSIGGPFTLTDHTGARVTDADVIDRPTLIYFGYTFCPDVCPVDVAIMAQAAEMLREDGRDVNAVFITIDPARDDQQAIADFVSNMGGEIIGLTGTDEEIAVAAKAYRAYYAKPESDDPDYYTMDHSAFTYLMAPEVGFLDVFRRGDGPEGIRDRTACYLDALG